MAASTSSSALMTNRRWPQLPPDRSGVMSLKDTLATTDLDFAGDTHKMFPVDDGMTIVGLFVANGELDSGSNALDMDIVVHDDNGYTVLYNAGTAFTAAVTTPLWVPVLDATNYPSGYRVTSTDGSAWIGTYVNTAANNAASSTLTLQVFFGG